MSPCPAESGAISLCNRAHPFDRRYARLGMGALMTTTQSISEPSLTDNQAVLVPYARFLQHQTLRAGVTAERTRLAESRRSAPTLSERCRTLIPDA